MVQQGNASKDVTGLFTSYTASDPQFVITIDRERAKAIRVPLQQVTDALQIYMGSAYVNDFDFNNRSYRVYVQADKQFRSQPSDIRQFYVRAEGGTMVSLDNLVNVTQSTTPGVITHYNLFRSAEIDGAAAPGRSSGDAIAAMEALSRKALPRGYSYEWTGLSLEELQSAGTSALLFGLGALVAYVTLSGQQGRHPQRGVCRAATGARAPRRGRGGGGGAPAPPADPHDLARLHPRGRPARPRPGRRPGRPAFRGHDRLRGDDPVDRAEPLLHPGPVPRDRAGAGEAPGSAGAISRPLKRALGPPSIVHPQGQPTFRPVAQGLTSMSGAGDPCRGSERG